MLIRIFLALLGFAAIHAAELVDEVEGIAHYCVGNIIPHPVEPAFLFIDPEQKGIYAVNVNTYEISTFYQDLPLQSPLGLAKHPTNNAVLVADSEANCVYSINLHTKELSRFAGGGTQTANNILATDALLLWPRSIFSHVPTGDVFIAVDSRVMRVDTTGHIATFAGQGQLPLHHDPLLLRQNNILATQACLGNQLEITGDDNTLYIADMFAHRIYAVNITSNILLTIAGDGEQLGNNILAIEARISSPRSIAVTQNHILFSEITSMRLHSIDKNTGILNTIAGGGNEPIRNGALASNIKPWEEGYMSAIAVIDNAVYVGIYGGEGIFTLSSHPSGEYTKVVLKRAKDENDDEEIE